MSGRSLTLLTRLGVVSALVVLGCAFSLVGARSAPAALNWAGSSCVPCFDVAVVVVGDGHVTGVSPGSPEAGRIECAPQVVNGQAYDCEEYFLWLDGDPTVILTPSAGFLGWEPAPEDPTSTGCPQTSGTSCILNLDNTPLGRCIQATFTGSGTVGTCASSPPPGCTPNCGNPPPPPPPPGTGGGTGTGVPSWSAPCTIVGTARADVLRGTSGRNVICGRGGNDRLYGNGGNDLLRGQGGTDKLYGGAGIDRLDGGLGADVLNGNGGKDQERGGGGADTFYARDGLRDALVGGPGRDRARADRVDSLSGIERRF
jgi:hypothetical protein